MTRRVPRATEGQGIDVTPILNHDDSPTQVSREVTDRVFVRSVYFFDPDGICLEFAAWTRPFTASDVAHEPVRADGTRTGDLVLDRR